MKPVFTFSHGIKLQTSEIQDLLRRLSWVTSGTLHFFFNSREREREREREGEFMEYTFVIQICIVTPAPAD